MLFGLQRATVVLYVSLNAIWTATVVLYVSWNAIFGLQRATHRNGMNRTVKLLISNITNILPIEME